MEKAFWTIVAVIFAFNTSFAQSGELVLEGSYQGKNLYVQNPFQSSGVGFCVFEVRVNDQVTTDEINSSAFEIDFLSFQLELGSPVVVKIKHKDGCTPRVLNPEVLKPRATFQIGSIKAERDGTLNWTTTGETGPLPFIVEQYRWNKWVKVGEVQGKGSAGQNSYSFSVTAHSGTNKLRIKQVDYTGPKYSKVVNFRSSVAPVVFTPTENIKTEITFTNQTSGEVVSTMYEVFDQFGNVVRRGFGSKIDVAKLEAGTYWINYDKVTGSFTKK